MRNFSVDLRGVVDLLSRHLYSSPRVYVRELLQNAVDAITARGGGWDAAIRIRARGDGELQIHDTGIGLTEAQVHRLLATIGNSSKRDELGFARHDFLGQFGIGLLSCFLVADEIEVVTKSAVEDAPAVVWRGHADGHYTVREGRREQAGTTVTLRARRDFEHWLEPSTVMELARHYGALLPYDIRVNGEPVTEGPPPWEREWPTERERRRALLQYGTRIVGAEPFDVIDLAVPEAGLRGVAYVLPHQTSPGEPARHRVYLKRMLLSDRAEQITPEWAFFVRCVLDSEELRPTASREQLYDDELLDRTREALGGQLRGWLLRLAATEPERLRAFLAVHGLGVKAMATRDVEMLRVVDEWIAFQTSEGEIPLSRFRARHRTIRYTAQDEEFQQFAGIAAAQGIALVNGGYAYDVEILERLRLLDPDLDVRRLEPAELATRLDPVGPDVAFAARDFLRIAERALAGHGCEPALRAFAPATLPVLYLEGTGPAADPQEAGGVWAQFAADTVERARPMLVFNHRNPLIARLTGTVNTEVVVLAVEALYGYALLAGRRPMRPEDVAAVNRAFLGLVEHAVHRETP